jgi:hypothetical protein
VVFRYNDVDFRWRLRRPRPPCALYAEQCGLARDGDAGAFDRAEEKRQSYPHVLSGHP